MPDVVMTARTINVYVILNIKKKKNNCGEQRT